MSTELRASYKARGLSYSGAVRDGNKIVWTCEHIHNNRTVTTRWSGDSALYCAEKKLREMQSEAAA